jgi:hypothetical protein
MEEKARTGTRQDFKEPVGTSKNQSGLQRTSQDFEEPIRTSKNRPQDSKNYEKIKQESETK